MANLSFIKTEKSGEIRSAHFHSADKATIESSKSGNEGKAQKARTKKKKKKLLNKWIRHKSVIGQISLPLSFGNLVIEITEAQE